METGVQAREDSIGLNQKSFFISHKMYILEFSLEEYEVWKFVKNPIFPNAL